MGERSLFRRAYALAVVMSVFGALHAGCADGNTNPGTGRRDAGEAGVMDTGVVTDANVRPDAGDAGTDAVLTMRDAGEDTGPHTLVGTCEACTTDLDCDVSSYCARLVTGDHACLPGCDSEFPMCPRGFSCIFDATGTGVHANICAPVGGPCCVDEDADLYGVGVGCMGPDCNDGRVDVHPGRDEICDGIDTNCNAHIDEDPNDCMSGRCTADGDGSYSSIVGAMCHLSACTSGTMTDCALYTCHDGAAMGTTCATMCAPAGMDEDRFCILTAHCDSAACILDTPNGGTCDEDSDCSSSHCENGFCCATGQCCATTSDCPGGGTLSQVCDDPTHCQGHHGTVTCMSNTCATESGIDDDTACTPAIVEATCGTYNPVMCDGTMSQTARTCPMSCIGDADCITLAHCAVGFCLPDLPPGAPCSRGQDCQDGLSCVDGTCCTTACNGSCEACNIPGSAGTCTPIGSGGDPAGECAGFTCATYFSGFTGSSDVCQIRQPVSDSEATCDGTGHCRTAATLCPLQLPGAVQIDCNDTCQRPHAGTCTGTTAGVCDNQPPGSQMCGTGACITTVPVCVSGFPQMCMAGGGTAESCDGVDNNCNGTVDDGGGALCGNPGHVMTPVCNGGSGCSVGACASGFADYDMSFGNGCECDVSGGGNVCGSPTMLGNIAVGGTMDAMALIRPGGSSWFTASFPPNAGTAGRGGTPSVSVSPTDAFTITVFSNCAGGNFVCNEAATTSVSAGLSSFGFNDSISNGPSGYTSTSQTWPTTVFIEVRRNGPSGGTPTTCDQARFTLHVARP